MRWPGRKGAVVNDEINATEAALDYAETEGVDLSEVEGTGTDGRITKDDVEAFVKGRTKPTTSTAIDAAKDPYGDLRERSKQDAPPEGADHPDPYAHLGGSVDPATYEETTTDDDEEGDDSE